MGCVTFVISEDSCQRLPVIARGTRADIVKASLKSSAMWNAIQTINLRSNMRAHLGGGDSDFPTNLLGLGDGSVPNDDSFTETDQKMYNIPGLVKDTLPKAARPSN